jgi:hypothetical protein
MSFDTAPFVVEQILPHVGYSSQLGMKWGVSKQLVVVVENNVVGPAGG